MRAGPLLLLAALAPSGSDAAKYFGYYDANLTVNAPYSNLFQADTLQDALAAKAAKQEVLLLVYNAFFIEAPSGQRLILSPNYVAQWTAMASAAAPYIANGTILGFNMGDELVWNCLAPANLTIAVNAVRASFPRGSAVIWYNEATPPIASDVDSCGNKALGYTIPTGLDWYSTDIYHMDGAQAGWVQGNVRSFYEAHIFPRLAPGQLVTVVPGSFGSNVNSRCDQACYDRMCAADAVDFAAWAGNDTRIIGIQPWNWGGCPPCAACCKDELGTNVQPLATAAWSAIGAAIVSGTGSHGAEAALALLEAAAAHVAAEVRSPADTPISTGPAPLPCWQPPAHVRLAADAETEWC